MPALSPDELDRLAAELASFERSGIPMSEGLRRLGATLQGDALQALSGELASALARGIPLSDALTRSAVQTPPEFIALVKCGESSGDMRSVLQFAVEHGRRLGRHRGVIVNAITYPILAGCICGAIVLGLLNFIVPKFREIFDQLEGELPWLTESVLRVSEVARGGPSWIAAAIALAALVLLIRSLRSGKGAFRILGLVGYMRSLVRLSDAAVLMKFLHVMLARGAPLPAALRAGSLALWSERARRETMAMSQAAEQGRPIGALMRSVLPATGAWLVQQSEERGDLAETCGAVGDYCEDRFSLLSERAGSALEPLMILFIGLLVGVVVISLYNPLFTIPKLIR